MFGHGVAIDGWAVVNTELENIEAFAATPLQALIDFVVCYTTNDHFASAEYTFPAFMDSELVGNVIRLVSSKYGSPDSQDGSMDLGSVQAVWHEGKGMQVKVSRGWPDTTTYLDLVDTANNQKLHQEIAVQKAQHNQQQAQQESNAF